MDFEQNPSRICSKKYFKKRLWFSITKLKKKKKKVHLTKERKTHFCLIFPYKLNFQEWILNKSQVKQAVKKQKKKKNFLILWIQIN